MPGLRRQVGERRRRLLAEQRRELVVERVVGDRVATFDFDFVSPQRVFQHGADVRDGAVRQPVRVAESARGAVRGLVRVERQERGLAPRLADRELDLN